MIDKAITFATKAPREVSLRKENQAPYLVHPLEWNLLSPSDTG